MRSEYTARRKTVVCNKCGVTFYPLGGNLKAKYCSVRCRADSQRGQSTYKVWIHHPTPPAKITTSVCKGCGKIFEHRVSSKPKYCKCWFHRSPKVEVRCGYCGVVSLKWRNSKAKYCNSTCYWSHLKILKKGENSHLWQGGKTRESKNIRSRAEYNLWRKRVYERDCYTCQDCGYKPNKKHDGTLHAHHIKSFSRNVELRTSIDNGLTLCESCHQKHHKHNIGGFRNITMPRKKE